MVTHSVLLTVYNRPIEVLLRTLLSLRECDLQGTEVIVVNDGSTLPYKSVRTYVADQFEAGIWHDMAEYDAFRLPDGSNNPARAFNQAASMARGENLLVMSSDVIVPPRAMAKAKKVDLSRALWTPYVEDTFGSTVGLGHEYCGPKRLFPMPWFLGVSRAHLLAVGGWDEAYLGGLCYEDNDVVGRLCLQTGRFIGDWSVKVYHQGHVQTAYMIEEEEVRAANARNREITMTKWGGIPFDAEFTPFDVVRKMQRSGDAAHECFDKAGKLDKAVAMTTGMLSVAHASR